MDIAKRFMELEEAEKQLKEVKTVLKALAKSKTFVELTETSSPEQCFVIDLYARYGATTEDEKKKLREHLLSDTQVNYYKRNIYS